jgi:hypothetical protein
MLDGRSVDVVVREKMFDEAAGAGAVPSRSVPKTMDRPIRNVALATDGSPRPRTLAYTETGDAFVITPS